MMDGFYNMNEESFILRENYMANIDYEYDNEHDILFIYITDDEDYKYNISVEINNNIILDLDENNELISLECLDASTVFNVDKNYFTELERIIIFTYPTLQYHLYQVLIDFGEGKIRTLRFFSGIQYQQYM